MVEVRVLGSELGVPTKVAVGYSPEAKSRLEALRKEKSRVEESLTKTEAGIAILEECKREGTFTSRRSDLYERVLNVREQLREEVERVNDELAETEATVTETVMADLKVRDVVFPNVTLSIKNASLLFTDEWRYAVFYEEEGEVKARPFA